MSAGVVSSTSEHIAIIGVAGRFPAARNVRRFWQMLAEGRTATRWLSDEELLAEGVSAADLSDPNYVRAANILPDMECFDAGFFGFSPREASILDPQHRHFLECAWEAFEDAGHVPEKFDGRIGVFAGSGMQAYLPFNLLSNPELVAQVGLFLLRHTGNDKDFMPTRLSYLLNLRGPSIAVQTACSTSLVAVHLASASLLSGECDMALAGGVTIELPHRQGYRFVEGEILSPDGLCRAFDDNSKGTVFGSGAAVVVLRRLDDAIADGDDIRAVIIGSAVNNDGSQKAGYLAPSVDGQAEAAAEALALAGIDPASVSYIEAHGTGTPVGDPIELAALTQAYGDGGRQFCGIGSVKTNVGHLDTAAGAASLIKVVEALRHETIPPSLNYSTPNSRFGIAASPFYVTDTLRQWPRGKLPRRAAVNSLGVGGTNAHLIVQEAPLRAATSSPEGWRILPFSARNDASLDELGAKWSEFLLGPDKDLNLADAAFTLQTGRRNFERRRAFVVRDRDGLRDLLGQGDKRRIVTGSAAKEAPGIVFMFPGGGAQFPGAGTALLETVPAFRQAVDACFAVMPENVPADLRLIMFEREATDADAAAQLERPIYALPALFVLEIAFARMWQSWGVQPVALIGHSAGEYAGAVISGSLSLADALLIVALRGQLMEDLPDGAMAAIPASETTVRELIGDELDFAAVNAPDLCVVSGPAEKIVALEAKLAGTDVEAKRLRINVAAHSRMLEPALADFRSRLEKISYATGNVPFVSTLRGDWAAPGDHVSADYWTRHLRNTVRFGAAMKAVLARPNQILLEIGPGSSLGSLAQMNDGLHKPVAVIASTRQAKETDDDLAFALSSAAKIWTAGGEIDWSALPGGRGQRISLPTYAFERQVHWVHPGKLEAKPATVAKPEILRRRDAVSQWFETKVWRETPLPGQESKRGENWLVFDAGDEVSAAIRAELRAKGARITCVRAGDEFVESDNEITLAPQCAEDFEKLFARTTAENILYLWRVADFGFLPSFLLSRALQMAAATTGVRLTFVTDSSCTVAGEPVTNPDGAMLLGSVRTVRREIPGIIAQLLDVDSTVAAAETAHLIIAETDADAGEDHVAFRGNKRFVQFLQPLVTAAPESAGRIKAGGTYVISGGTGGIGRELGRYLATKFKAKVTLLARSSLSHYASVSTLGAEAVKYGGSIRVLAADVTERAELALALESVRAADGPINGVFHAAGIMRDAPMAAKSAQDVMAVMAPKVAGGRNLSELLPVGSIDFFAVFSSSSVFIAPPGQVDYIAANAWLEALAASRPDGLSIAWGAWSDTGMAADAFGSSGEIAQLHPLLGAMVVHGDGAITFQTLCDPGRLWVLCDHVVGGVKILPGTAFVEIARAAFAQIEPGSRIDVSDFSLALPMAFPNDWPRHVRVRLVAANEGYDFRVESSLERDGPFIEHCRAHIAARSPQELVMPSGLEPQTGLLRSELSGSPLQKGLIDFGPRWQCVGEVRKNSANVEADLELAPDFVADLAEYGAHPALTDMAFTIGLHLLPELQAASDALYAPVSFGKLRILSALEPKIISRAVLRQHEVGKFARFDAAIFDVSGKPLLLLENLLMRCVSKAQLASFDEGAPSTTAVILQRGIRAVDAPKVFDHLFGTREPALVVSPLSLIELRREFSRASAQPVRRSAARVEANGGPVETGNKLEQRIAEFWQELLGVKNVRLDDDFFDLGGHSLSAVRLFAKIRKEYAVDLPLAALFDAQTVRKIAALVVAQRADLAELSRAETGLLAPEHSSADPGHFGAARTIETTDGQREIFGAILINPDVSKGYNLSFSLHMEGEMDVKALEQSLEELVQRHESLRSNFLADGLSLQILSEANVAISTYDLAGLESDARLARTGELHLANVEAAYDLQNGPLFRAVLIRSAPDRHELLLGVHHIVCDGWSIGVIMHDLSVMYSARVANTQPKLETAQGIGEFVIVEKAWQATESFQKHRRYWLNKFADAAPVMELTTDHPRPPVKSTNSARQDFCLSADLESRLRTMAGANRVTLENVIFAAFMLFAGRVTGNQDVVVGLPASGQLAHGLERVVGHCVNFLPIRSRFSFDETFLQLLANVRRDLVAAIDNQNFTYGSLVRDLKLKRDPSRIALVPIIFNIDNLTGIEKLNYAGLKTRFAMNPRAHENFELFVNLLDQPGRVLLSWTYNSDLFDGTSIAGFIERFRRLLEGISREPQTKVGDVGKFIVGQSAAARHDDDPGKDGPQTITEVFRTVAATYPDRIALRFGDFWMDYKTLDDRSNALAAQLAQENVKPGDLVGVVSSRSLQLIVAVLGTLKAGAGYVPFDLSLPAERLSFMLKDTGIKVLLGADVRLPAASVQTIAFDAFSEAEASASQPRITGESVAYVMYTSGTTGRPKGVVVPHRSVIRMLVSADWLRLSKDTVTLHSSSFAFDTSIIDIFGALLHGGCVVVPPDGALSLSQIGDAIAGHGVNTLWLTAGLFHAIADMRPDVFAKVDQLIVGGDVVSPVQVGKIQARCPNLTVINGYGPTESNVTNAHVVTPTDIASGLALPIGRAIRGTQTYILDENQNPVEPGVKGELYIAGRGLALGYWNRPELTAEKFIRAPWNSSLLLYRSGDMTSDPGDGVIRYFGRLDRQVKIRGYRVELAEIEAALAGHPGVRQAAVTAFVPDGQADKIIAAYYVTDSVAVTRKVLEEHLKSLVPGYALPSMYFSLQDLPLNTNGKVDQRSLPTVSAEMFFEQSAVPVGRVELALAEIWGQILGQRKIMAETSFFELGGHSLLAVRLFDAIRAKFGVNLPISTLFQNPSIRQLGQVIECAAEATLPASIGDEEWDTSTKINSGPSLGGAPLFVVGGVGGNVNNLYEISQILGRSRPVIGFQTRGILGHMPRATIEAMASEHIKFMRQHQSKGPYFIAGYSGGALTAFEMARILAANGEDVAELFILDTFAPGFAVDFVPNFHPTMGQRLRNEVHLLREFGLPYLAERAKVAIRHKVMRGPVLEAVRFVNPTKYLLRKTENAWRNAARRYIGGNYAGSIVLFQTSPKRLVQKLAYAKDPTLGWTALAEGNNLQRIHVNGDHTTMLIGENAVGLAATIEARIARSAQGSAQLADQASDSRLRA